MLAISGAVQRLPFFTLSVVRRKDNRIKRISSHTKRISKSTSMFDTDTNNHWE